MKKCRISNAVISTLILVIFFAMCLATYDVSRGSKQYTPNLFTSVYHPGKRNYSLLSQITHNVKNGNLVYEAELNLLKLIGVENYPRVAEAEAKAHALAASGSAAANTVLGFLMRHNLTSSKSSDVNVKDLAEKEFFREMSDIDYFIEAAGGGDPLAQLIVAEHYKSLHRCPDALDLYRKSAVQALTTIDESKIAMASYGPYVEPSDGPSIHWPTDEEIEFLEYQASHGDADSAMQVAAIYISEELGLPYDIEKAERYLKIAINADLSTAMIFMAHLHIAGKVVNSDLGYAKMLLEKALDLGDPTAHAAYARFFSEGLAGVPQNLNVAIEHLQKGIEAGHVDSMYGMGQLLSTHFGGEREAEALEYWSIPAANGHVFASWYTAEYFTKLSRPNVRVIGAGTTEVSLLLCELALPLYKTVALAGEWSNLLYAAHEDFEKKRYDAAAIKYMLLSDLGYNVAHVNLGRLLQSQKISLFPSKEILAIHERRTWERAANHSMPVGNLQLAHHLYYGTGGLKPGNKSRAAQHYHKAMPSNTEAAFNLAYLYEWGEGVQQDIQKAYDLYTITSNASYESWLPSKLALARLNLFWIVNSTTGFNFYNLNYSDYSSYLIDFGEIVHNCVSVFGSIFYSYEFWLCCSIVILFSLRR